MCNDCQIVSFSLSPEEYGQVLAAMQRAGFADLGSFCYVVVMQRVADVFAEWQVRKKEV